MRATITRCRAASRRNQGRLFRATGRDRARQSARTRIPTAPSIIRSGRWRTRSIPRADQNAHFVYFSSSMVYGNFDGEAVSRRASLRADGHLRRAEVWRRKLVIAHNQVFETPYTIVRPSALYGERCVSRRVGQAFIENAIRGKSLTVNGDGTDALDFTYIGDLGAGHHALRSRCRKHATRCSI